MTSLMKISMNIEPKTKEKTCSSDHILLFSEHSLLMSPIRCKKLLSLAQVSPDDVSFSMENESFTNLTHVKVSVQNKQQLVKEHLNTCNECKNWLENSVCLAKHGVGGTPGITNTPPVSPQ